MKEESDLVSGADSKSSWIVVGFVAILLLWLSITSVGQVLALNPNGDLKDPPNILQPVAAPPAAIQFLPRRAPLVISTQAHLDNLFYGTTDLVNRPQREAIKQLWTDTQQYLTDHWLLDYGADVQPWIGSEITLAVTNSDLDQNPANGWQPGYLLAMQSNDVEQAKASVNNFWQRLATGGVDLAFGQSQGIPLTYVKNPDSDPSALGQSLSSMILGGYVLFANDPLVLRNAIQTLQVPSLGLTSWDIYQKANQNLTEPSLVTGFVNLDEVAAWRDDVANLKAVRGLAPLPSGGLGLRFHWDEQGLHAVTTLAHDENSPALVPTLIGTTIKENPAKTSTTNDKTQTPSLFNANEFATKLATIPNHSNLWIGYNLAQTLNVLSTYQVPSLQKPLQDIFNRTLKPLTANWVLPIDQSTLAWVTEGYGLAVFPTKNYSYQSDAAKSNVNQSKLKQPLPSSSGADWLLIAQKTPNAHQSLDALDEAARHDAKLTVGTVDFAGHPLTLWTQFNRLQSSSSGESGSMVAGNVVAVHTEVDQLVYFSNSLPILQAALQGNLNIFQQPEFTNFVKHQYRAPQTYIYLGENIDLASLTNRIVKMYLGKTWFSQPWQLPSLLTEDLKTIGFSLTDQDPQQISGEIFFGTK